VINWTTVSSLATGGGTLILAVSTFAAVRSANRAARTAERSLLAGLRPVLVASRLQDGEQKIFYGDRKWVLLRGGGAAAEPEGEVIYLALSLRNAGSGLAVLHGWLFHPERISTEHPPDTADFTRQTRDMYVPAGDTGFWQGAFRDPAVPAHRAAQEAIKARGTITIDLLYGDHEGGQRMITRFAVQPRGEDGWLTGATRHWNLDRPDPR
jgi:hypothetical protein